MKNNKGITLVALVVTIIVLIILAGVSINLTLGDNGIITTAQKAKENMELAKVEEERELNELYTQLETGESSSGNLPYDSMLKLTEFKTAIANAIEEAGGVKPDTSAETSVFANNIKGILKEVTKDATATASDIASGKTAYVNGEKIIGIGNSGLGDICSAFISMHTEGYIGVSLYNSKTQTTSFLSRKDAGKTIETDSISVTLSTSTTGIKIETLEAGKYLLIGSNDDKVTSYSIKDAEANETLYERNNYNLHGNITIIHL